MPNRPKRICSHLGCNQLTDGGKCDNHRLQTKRTADKRRGTSTERGYNSRWRAYRLSFLQINPLCVECEKQGRLVPATVVDHIIPFKADRDLFWRESNHQPLCKRCHDRKTAREDGGFGNARG